MNIKANVKINEAISATIIEIHMPSVLRIRGKIITQINWKTKVLKIDISAEMTPLFKAVKKEEPYIENPEKR